MHAGFFMAAPVLRVLARMAIPPSETWLLSEHARNVLRPLRVESPPYQRGRALDRYHGWFDLAHPPHSRTPRS